MSDAGEPAGGGVPPDPPPFEPFAIERSERIYDSPWCGLRRDLLRLDADRVQEHHVLEISPAVAVVPLLPDGRILLLWQYRHPLGRTHWEVPAGRIMQGEEPAAAAARELLEETGHAAGTLERLAGFYPTNGISAHYAHVFAAHACERVAAQSLDPSERITVHPFPAEEVRDRLARGAFEDGFTALSLAYHFLSSSP